MAAVNVTANTHPPAELVGMGAGGGSQDWLLETANSTLWNDTEEIGPTNNSIPYVPYELRLETYLVPILFALIFIIGVIGESLCLVVYSSFTAKQRDQ